MIIFSPGPANISERVRRALTRPDICHRDTEFSQVLKDVRDKLLLICGAKNEYESIVFTGSGTLAIEAAISSLKDVFKSILVISNGIYGRRAFDIAKLHDLNAHKIDLPNNRLPDLNLIKSSIKKRNTDVVYLVHHETTTGLVNPLSEIGEIAKREGCRLLVDGVSSIGGEKLILDNWGIDSVVGSSNKCIRGAAGLSFVIASKDFLKMISGRKKSAYYPDLTTHYIKEKEGQTPFTPAVQIFYALNEALDELLEEGVENRILQYRKISKILRDGLRKTGFKLYLPDEINSNTMTSVFLPTDINYEYLHHKCKESGYVIYDSVEELKGKTFRLGTAGNIKEKDIEDFIALLKHILNEGNF